MKQMNSDTASKTIRNLQAEISSLLMAEDRDSTYTYGVSEKPCPPHYSFRDTQKRLGELRSRIAVLKHAIYRFNATTPLPGHEELTVDEGLGRMSMLNQEKERLYQLLQVPEKIRQAGYGTREADFVCRNFDIDEVQVEYDRVCEELMEIQQAINLANLTLLFEVDL